MTFREWWTSQGHESYRPNSNDLVNVNQVQKAWDFQASIIMHQAAIIDRLLAELAIEEESYREDITFVLKQRRDNE